MLLICSILALSYTSPYVVAEDTSDDSLAEAGLTLIALRNDTLDTNQDGDNDAIRVVVVFNSEQDNTNLELRLVGEYKDREVTEVLQFTFSGQSNASLVYDAWASGEHELKLQIVDQDGEYNNHYSITDICPQTSTANTFYTTSTKCTSTH